jgi:16S rRNA (cytidine1402-2'-O)-methyltransferase
MVSLREHNEGRETPRLLDRMAGGASIALVTDAGTPTIADPGAHLISAARRAGLKVVPIPGASAIMTALSGIGLPADRFRFLGFPPVSGQDRDRWFDDLEQTHETVVFYEAPHRISRTLTELAETLGNRHIIIGRELTKQFEELVEWDKKTAIQDRGEFVVVVGPVLESSRQEPEAISVATLVGYLTKGPDIDDTAAVAMAAAHYGLTTTRTRNLAKKGAIALKRSADNY